MSSEIDHHQMMCRAKEMTREAGIARITVPIAKRLDRVIGECIAKQKDTGECERALQESIAILVARRERKKEPACQARKEAQRAVREHEQAMCDAQEEGFDFAMCEMDDECVAIVEQAWPDIQAAIDAGKPPEQAFIEALDSAGVQGFSGGDFWGG